ncbi:hypothetical protein [Bifidobacterium catenulatum]|uniref:hypothetical protein n=1 Tax=Bifidobacterium catenulatum TaxID=1686 RepID=UPI0022E06FF4|nr:hypothetical protein [Bifidobacterium catenulatum]
MTSHVELNPDDNVLGLSLGMKAMRLALTQKTHKVGTVRIPTGGDADVIIGDGAQDGANRIDRDGNQLPLVDTSGIDKAAQDARKAADDAAAKADEAIKQGEQIRQDAQAGIDDARKQAQDAAAKADKARSDLQAEMDANKQAADNAIANVDKKADKAQSDLEAQTAALKSSIANVDAKAEQVKADASKISQRVDADKAALDKSIASVDAKAQAASDKGDQLAGQISDVTTTVNGHTTKLGELSTRIEGVASDGQTTVKSLTSLQQTVTGLSSTVSQNTKTASDAMSKVSQVEQTANGISANLSKNYTTTADADEKYAAKTELKATADGLQANITRSQQTADGAVTAASKAQATADGFGATLSKDYQTTAASDEKYSTKADLKATSDSISSSLSSVKQTADGAVTAASKAQQTADAVTLNLSKNYQTKAQNDAVYATKTDLKVTSDSLSASISSTAKTAQSAVDKATNLEANLNGFKTTVSQTYTTKTDFNSLQIGGTNLCPKSNPYNISLSNASKDSSGVITGTVPTNANATCGASVTPGYATHLKTPYGRQCVISFDVWSEIAATVVVDINNMPESVAAWNGNDNDGWRGGVQPTTTTTTNGAVACSIPAKQWIRLWVTYSNTSAKNTGKVDIFDQSHIGLRPASAAYQVKFKDFKFELGSRPTEYSPCPSDLQSAGDYATKSELSQTADGIKAQVSEASKTASGAMSKATTLEQTANSLSSTITAQGKTLEATTKTANTAKATADSNTTAISQVKSTADGTVTRISNLEQNLDGFKTTVAKTYQDKAGMSNYATNSALKQTSDTITSQVSEVSKTASGAMSKVTSLEQTANGLSTKITEQGKTLDATVKTANEAKSTADSNKTAISQVSTTANNALSKTSSLEQNLSGFKTSVANTYTTKADFNNLTIGGTNLLLNTSGVFVGHPSASGVNANAGWLPRLVDGLTYSTLSAGTYQLRFEVMTDTEVGSYIVQWADTPWGISSFSLSKGVWKTLTYTIVKPDGATGKARGFMLRTDNVPTSATIRVRRAKLERGSRPTDWSPAPQDSQAAGDYATNSSLTQAASQIRSEVAEKYQSKSGMSSYATTSALTQKANEITGKVQEVAKTAQGNTTTISQVSQKADKINTTLSQKIDGKADVSRVSSLEQSLSGFKTSVAQSYQPKGDYPTKTEMQSNISQSASSIKSEVANTYTTQTATEALRKSATRTFTLTGAAGKAKWVKLGYLTSNGDDSSVLIHVYSGNGHNGQASQNAEFEIFVKDGWQQSASATSAFGVSVSRIRNADDVKVKVMAFSSCTCDIWAYLPWAYWNGHYTLHGNYKSWQDGPNCGGTRIQDAEPTSGTAQDLAYDTLSTRSYVDQTAKSVALGVVQNYQGSDGSGLATKSDITAAKASVTSTVASTYATKTGVTQEISSKITQNNNSLDVKFATKVETQNAQNKANTADSHATNAQSRVGSLEDCINFTASGVRVGKRSNGKFTGVSALVNTNGTFDLLDASGNLLTRINQHRFQVTGDDGTGGGYLSLSQDGINITVQPTADASKTYHIQVGKSGVGITAPDGSSIGCSASGGLNIETVKYGKISIGAGGLQFTNDQGWGLRLSAAGWSLKWAGSHTLATGPAAGKLYIDGREIVTR